MDSGQPMQRSIVEAAMAGKHVLGILPTGTGKSLCYQIPALSRYDKTGALTVVISPLVALMADQVAGLEARGVVACVAINGLLSLPERADALDRVRLGDAGILIISPEQLRNPKLAPRSRPARDRRLGAGRGPLPVEVGTRLSGPTTATWGASSARRRARSPIPPVLCLTATARPDVRDDIALPLPRRARHRADGLRRRRPAREPGLRGGADHGRREARPPAPDPDVGPAAAHPRRRHRLLRHAPADRGGGGVPPGEGRHGGLLSLQAVPRDQEERAESLHRG